MREIRTYGLMRGCWPERFVRRVGVYSTERLQKSLDRSATSSPTRTLAQCRATLAAERVEGDCEARKQGRELARPVTDNGATTAVVALCNRGRVRAFTGSAAFFVRAALAA